MVSALKEQRRTSDVERRSTVKFCLPILKSSQKQVLEVLEKQTDEFDIFEIWLDYIRDLDLSFLQVLTKKFPKDRLLFLFRRQNLEQIQLPFETRVQFIRSLGKDVLLDLDISTQQDELEFALKEKVKTRLVLSYHNYKFTPESSELRDLIASMVAKKAAICKIATMCRSERDALRLLELLLEVREKGQRCVILGMGEAGKITRVVGSLWGNEFIYAPLRTGESSAPQQLTKRQLDTILKELR